MPEIKPINVDETRISKIRLYLFNIIDELLTSNEYQINSYMLSSDINNYSLDKMPVQKVISQGILGIKECQDQYSFRSRNSYSQDTLVNLINVGFFEIFEKTISSNNERGILPEIENIEEIHCLNCGTMVNAESSTAEFDIQIQIIYREV